MAATTSQAFFRSEGKHHLEFRIDSSVFTTDISEVTFDFTGVGLYLNDKLKIHLRCGLIDIVVDNFGQRWCTPPNPNAAESLELASYLHTEVHAPQVSLGSSSLSLSQNIVPSRTFPEMTLPQGPLLGKSATTRATAGPAPRRTNKSKVKAPKATKKGIDRQLQGPGSEYQVFSIASTPVASIPAASTPESYPPPPMDSKFAAVSDEASTNRHSVTVYPPGIPSSGTVLADATSGFTSNRPSPVLPTASSSAPVQRTRKRGREEDDHPDHPGPSKRPRKNAKTSAMQPASVVPSTDMDPPWKL